ncbi:MAG TPA: DinB family protein [Propionibacteriaceae bacterium]|nr:DinB family protein [Propionibacteriaceae bacterium]
MADDEKTTLKRYLQDGRDALLWKLEGLGEREIRLPMTATGTNLLGVVKHVASVEIGYFTEVFGRPCDVDLPWFAEGAEPNADMWATPDQSRESIVELYHRSWQYSDATIDELPLDAPGVVPWWPEGRRDVTLHRILVHMIAETHRHAGHADIVRELIDGARGLLAGRENLPSDDENWWADYVSRVRQGADSFSPDA